MTRIKSETEEFVKQKFAEYYHEHSHEIQPPTFFERREFGFLLFTEKMMIRHKGFRRIENLRRFLETTVPSDVYYSAARYERPEESMEAKGWLGADLIFDVDADHIETPCKNEHDRWICLSCGAKGNGPVPESCPRCSSQKFEEKTWLCENCLEAAKVETLKLVDMLISDFGFSSDELVVCFSGHRGYHVHVEKESILHLDQLARKEIVDYVRGTGLDAEYHGLYERIIGINKRSSIVVGPALNDPGWRGRLARGIYDFLTHVTPEQVEKIGVKKRGVAVILERKDAFLKAWQTKAPWDAVRGLGIGTWEKVMTQAVKTQAASIDTVVTTDLHRLIRLPATIHGKTGLKVVTVPVGKLEAFDPLQEAIAFTKGTLTICVTEALAFRLGSHIYGPYKDEKVELPMAAAMSLLCKKAASPC